MIRYCGVATILLGLTACEAPVEEVAPPVRAIKTMTVSEVGAGQVRRFSAVVEASDTSTLSFQVSGNVQAVNAGVGDRVVAGDVIAVLDKAPYELDVQAALADLDRAQAELHQAELEFDRQRELHDKGWVSKAAFDQSEAALQSSRANVNFATSRLNQARRDLRNTELKAPFDGTLADRMVEPFQDVQTGQALFEINADGALEVVFSVPETEIAPLAMGQPVDVRFSVQSLPAERLAGPVRASGRITEISQAAGEANAFPVTAALLDTPGVVRPGMTAEVAIQVRIAGGNDSGYLVPLVALDPGGQPPVAYLYRYDPTDQVVRRIQVRVATVQDNNIIVTDGVAPGDVIVVAGVSFLTDGQAVKLLGQS